MPSPKPLLVLTALLSLGACHSSSKGGNPDPDLSTPSSPAPLPQLLADINPGLRSSLRSDFVRFAGQVYFLAEDGSQGIGLWRSDGSPAGTQLVRGLQQTGGQPPRHSELRMAHGRLYIGIDDQLGQGQAWQSDGTEAGTQALASPWPGDSGPRHMAVLGGRLCLATSRELWAFDPQGGELRRLGETSLSTIPWLHAHGGQLFFQRETLELGLELWRSDGTPTGTRLVKNLSQEGDTPLEPLAGFGSSMLFWVRPLAGNPLSGQLVQSDGTEAGTSLRPGIWYHLGARPLTTAGSLFFGGRDKDGRLGLYGFDGTSPKLLAQVLPQQTNLPGVITEIFALPGRLVFATAVYNKAGAVLPDLSCWSFDLGGAGLELLAELGVGPKVDAVLHHGALYFHGVDAGGAGLFRSDGSVTGTTRLLTVPPIRDPKGAEFNPFGGLCSLQAADKLLFQRLASDAVGAQLWVSDGTPAGTVALQDEFYGDGPAPLSAYTVLGGGARAVVAVNTAAAGFTGLWVSDGSRSGTRRVADLAANSIFEKLLPLGDKIIYRSRSNSLGEEPHALELGAQSSELWPNCQGGDAQARLSASDPWLDEALRFAGQGRAGEQAYLCFDLPRPELLNPRRSCGLLVPAPVIANPVACGPDGRWGLEFKVPNEPALQGQSFISQTVLVSAAAGLRLRLSNGVLLHMQGRP